MSRISAARYARSSLLLCALGLCCGEAPTGSAEVDARPADAAEELASADTGPEVADLLPHGDAQPADVDTQADGDAQPADVDAQADGDAQPADVDARADGDVEPPCTVGQRADPVYVDLPAAADETWRSTLYARDWRPGTRDELGRGVADFSHAGCGGDGRRCQAPDAAPVVSVLDRGADPTGRADSTAAFQSAIDELVEGGVVLVPAGLFRIDGLLRVARSGVVIRGEGTERTGVYFTRVEGMTGRAHLTFGGRSFAGPELPLLADASPGDTSVTLGAEAVVRAGDRVVLGHVISPEFVDAHGMTGVWTAFNDTWQPFARRQAVAIPLAADGTIVELDVPLREPLLVRDGASARVWTPAIVACGLESLAVASAVAWSDAWSYNRSHIVHVLGAEDCWIRDVRSFVPPTAPVEDPVACAHIASSGIRIGDSRRITVEDVHLARAQSRGSGGNGYLFEVGQSNEVLFRDCSGTAGRHNFIQNWGFGASGNVWTGIVSRGGESILSEDLPFGAAAPSEFHHSLATANLIERAVLDDGWHAVNRGDYSTGAGHSATQNVFWNVGGAGVLRTQQFGWGYVFGTHEPLRVEARVRVNDGAGTEPEDLVEGEGQGAALTPTSLWADQLARRLDLAP